jgi:hypothetical protein
MTDIGAVHAESASDLGAGQIHLPTYFGKDQAHVLELGATP